MTTDSTALAQTVSSCPAWCQRCTRQHGSHDESFFHIGPLHEAGQAHARLVKDDDWDRNPLRLIVGHYVKYPDDESAVLLPLGEAEDMAKLMAHLGHEDLAAAIRQAAADVQ